MFYSRILLPTDGSEHSLRAAAHAAPLANEGADIFVVTVVPEIPAVIGGEHRKMAEREIRAGALLLTDPVLAIFNQDGVKALAETIFDNSPADGILKAAERYGCDLIVMGTRGRSDFEGLFLGSVTHKVLAHAAVPVLVVR